MTLNRKGALPIALIALAGSGVAAASASDPTVTNAGRQVSTDLISRSVGGGIPNGPSTNAVISGDRRYARLIAFESDASNLVRGDTNGQKDVFVVPRSGSVDNQGTPWRGSDAVLVSRPRNGGSANGASFGASVSGDFRHAGRCIAFLSRASNIVSGDTNGRVDAFMVGAPGRAPVRVSPGGGRQLSADVNSVTVSGDCSRVSFTAGGALWTKRGGGSARRVRTRGSASDPQYATGNSNALVYVARGGVYLSRNGTSRGRRVTRGGRNPVFNDLKRRTLAYEKRRGGRTQIGYKDIGRRERIISRRGGRLGNGDSREPVIGNSGFYVTFESSASNLTTDAGGGAGDSNGQPDVYQYTDAREITLLRSVNGGGGVLRGGGRNGGSAYYGNYIVFDSPAPLGAAGGAHQIYMRYLGGI